MLCRHRREGSADTEERDNQRPGLLGDGPTPGRRVPPAYDDDDDEYYYDETEHTYDDDDAGRDNVDENYTDDNTAQTGDIGEESFSSVQ